MRPNVHENRTSVEIVADRMRAIVLDRKKGALVGSEEELVSQFGCSRSTFRQVARLLEREGLLVVKRGLNGGYFGSRPNAGTIEATVSAYLQTLTMEPSEITILASALWVEALRRAASAEPSEREAVCEKLRRRFKVVSDKATFSTVRDLELASQDAIFNLANANYIKLIFDINVAFSRRRFPAPETDDDSPEHVDFVRKWRDAKLTELNAVASGDRELAALTGKYSRRLWYGRIGRRFRGFEGENVAS